MAPGWRRLSRACSTSPAPAICTSISPLWAAMPHGWNGPATLPRSIDLSCMVRRSRIGATCEPPPPVNAVLRIGRQRRTTGEHCAAWAVPVLFAPLQAVRWIASRPGHDAVQTLKARVSTILHDSKSLRLQISVLFLIFGYRYDYIEQNSNMSRRLHPVCHLDHPMRPHPMPHPDETQTQQDIDAQTCAQDDLVE